MRKHAVALLVVAAMFSASVAFADDSRVGGEPGNVRAIPSTDIRMEAEAVQAVIYGRFAEYVADFRFVNSGPEQRVRLGFPSAYDDKTAPSEPHIALAGFQAYLDGEPLEVTISDGSDGPRQVVWFEHEALLPPGASVVRVRYLARPAVQMGMSDAAIAAQPPQYAGMQGHSAAYPYTLHTGAGWAGTIGRAVVRYTLADTFEGWWFGKSENQAGFFRTRPAGYARPDDRTLLWVIEDFEPAPDPETGESPFDISAAYYAPQYGLSHDGSPANPEWAQKPIAEISASSVSEGTEYDAPKHSAEAAADGDPATAWVSKDGAKTRQWLRLTPGETGQRYELRVVPGLARTHEEYRAHGRPKTIEYRFASGGGGDFELADEPIVQSTPILAEVGEHITLTVTDTYPGAEFDDVAIAEIELGREPAPRFLPFEEALALEATPVAGPSSDVTTPPSPVVSEPAQGARRSPIAPLALGGALLAGTWLFIRRRSRAARRS